VHLYTRSESSRPCICGQKGHFENLCLTLWPTYGSFLWSLVNIQLAVLEEVIWIKKVNALTHTHARRTTWCYKSSHCHFVTGELKWKDVRVVYRYNLFDSLCRLFETITTTIAIEREIVDQNKCCETWATDIIHNFVKKEEILLKLTFSRYYSTKYVR